MVLHAMKVAERAGNARGTGARRSFGWQKSVRRIARLVLRSCWSQGRRAWRGRALARGKLGAPPDAGPEPREGETVRKAALMIKSQRRYGSRVSARRLSIRRKVFSD